MVARSKGDVWWEEQVTCPAASALPDRAVPTGLTRCLPGADGQTLGELCAGTLVPLPLE